jgi:tetratricopeptide (TPR) repeat protein
MTYKSYSPILLIAFLIMFFTSAPGQNAGGESYESIILRAEQLMDQKNYKQAKTEYENALRANPEANYPRIKLQQIREVYVDPDDARRYNNYISEGERLFNQQEYKQAREQFFWANVLKPEEKQPLAKLKEIDGQLKELDRKKILYDKSIKVADSLFNLMDYQSAMNEYLYASGLLPNDTYARKRVDEINKLFEATRQEKQAYQQFVDEADQLYMIQDYNAALKAYNKALQMKPGESYPLSMVDRINAMADDQRSLESVYASVIENADRLFNEADLNASKAAYEHALRLKAGEQYPREQIAQIETLLAEYATSEEARLEALALASQYYQDKEYENALAQFKIAETIKALTDDQAIVVAEIEAILVAEQAYKDLLANADNSFASAKFPEAREQYNELLQMKPEAAHPASRITEIDNLLANLEQQEAAYQAAITMADNAFDNKDYEQALGSYQQAGKLKPTETHPKQRLEKTQAVVDLLSSAADHFTNQDYQSALEQYRKAEEILPLKEDKLAQIREIEVLIENEKAYTALRTNADELFASKEYSNAHLKYNEALQLKPGSNHDANRIKEIDGILAAIAEKDLAYTKAIDDADLAFKNQDYKQSLASYQQAVSLKPEEEYPGKRAAEVQEIIKDIEAKQIAYNENVAEANSRFDAGEYQQSIAAYKEALKYKPKDQYAENRIAEARSLVSEAEINESYANAVSTARFHEDNNDLVSALSSWETASGLKPQESLPKEKMAELSGIVEAEMRKIQEAYDKAIADGDRYFTTKVFDQAIESYTEAGRLKPNETYPSEQIDAIRKYIEERAIVDLVSSPVSVVSGDEKRFDFAPVDMRVRRNNYVILTLRFANTESSRFFLNYGLDSQKSGGIVLRNPGGKEETQFIVRVSSQDRWYRIDNNWLSIYPEGSDVEIVQLRISSGD